MELLPGILVRLKITGDLYTVDTMLPDRRVIIRNLTGGTLVTDTGDIERVPPLPDSPAARIDRSSPTTD